MLHLNIDPCKAQVRGSRKMLRGVAPNTLQLTLATDLKAGSKLCLPSMSRAPSDDSSIIQSFLRTQFLDCVCFAIITNKAPF